MRFFRIREGKKIAMATFLLLVNICIACKYLSASVWVLFNSPQEVLTGTTYDWTLSTVLVSWLFMGVVFFLLAASVGVFLGWKKTKHVIFSSAFVLGCIELFESVSLHFEYGTDFHDLGQYAYGPLLVLWAVLSFYIATFAQRE